MQPRLWTQLAQLAEVNRRGFNFQLGGWTITPADDSYLCDGIVPLLLVSKLETGCAMIPASGWDVRWAYTLAQALEGSPAPGYWSNLPVPGPAPWDLPLPPPWELRRRATGQRDDLF